MILLESRARVGLSPVVSKILSFGVVLAISLGLPLAILLIYRAGFSPGEIKIGCEGPEAPLAFLSGIITWVQLIRTYS